MVGSGSESPRAVSFRLTVGRTGEGHGAEVGLQLGRGRDWHNVALHSAPRSAVALAADSDGALGASVSLSSCRVAVSMDATGSIGMAWSTSPFQSRRNICPAGWLGSWRSFRLLETDPVGAPRQLFRMAFPIPKQRRLTVPISAVPRVVGSGTYDPREVGQQVLPRHFAVGDFFDLSGARRWDGSFPRLPLADKLRADAEAPGKLSLGADVADCLMKGIHSG